MGLMDEYRPFAAYQSNSHSAVCYWLKPHCELSAEHREKMQRLNAAISRKETGLIESRWIPLRVNKGRWFVAKLQEIAPDGGGTHGEWPHGYNCMRYVGFIPTAHIPLLEGIIQMRPAKFNQLMCKVQREYRIGRMNDVPFRLMSKYATEIEAGKY